MMIHEMEKGALHSGLNYANETQYSNYEECILLKAIYIKKRRTRADAAVTSQLLRPMRSAPQLSTLS